MRPTIMVFNKFYLPGFKAGGPIQSISNLTEALSGDFEFRIVARDRDSGDPGPYPDVWLDEWNPVGSGQVRYLDSTQGRISQIRQILADTPHHALYLNSFFDIWTMLSPCLANLTRGKGRRPVIVAPRGEFSPGALKIKSGKKRLFIAGTKLSGLHRMVHWHASSCSEADEIAAVMGARISIHTASNIPRPLPATAPDQQPRLPNDPLRVVFLSRISPKKNLTFALDVLKTVDVPVRFTIVGFIDDAHYWQECRAKIAGLPEHIEVEVVDPVPAHQVPQLLSTQDLFFLPTLGENFGHAIIEALSAGTPVLVSDQTPWRDLQTKGVGADLSLNDAEAFASWLKKQSALTAGEVTAQRQRCFEFAQSFAAHDDLVAASRRMFERVIGRTMPNHEGVATNVNRPAGART